MLSYFRSRLAPCGGKPTDLLDTARVLALEQQCRISLGAILKPVLILVFLLGLSFPAKAQPPCPMDGVAWWFLGDLSFPDGTEVSPGETIYKGWKLKNCGTVDWFNFKAVRVEGNYGPEEIPLPDAKSLDEFELWVYFTVPDQSGDHKAEYKIEMPSGAQLAESFWVLIRVVGQTFTLTIVKSGSGTVQSNPGGIDCGGICSADFNEGSSVSLSAEPADGYLFAGWSGDSDCMDGVVEMNGDRTCRATFEPSSSGQFTLTVLKTGSGSGQVTGPGIDCGEDCWENYLAGGSVALSAFPDAGSTFAGWGGDCNSAGQVVMDSNKQCTAEFTFGGGPNPSLALEISPKTVTVDQGWPADNPVEVTLIPSCPGPGDCSGNLTLTVSSALDRARFYVTESGFVNSCADPDQPFSRRSYHAECSITLDAGESRPYSWKLWIQPSQDAILFVSASWSGNTEEDSVFIEPASIHPVAFVHGILGSMPPKDLLIASRAEARDRLDPFVGSYWPLLDNLQKMGYEWNKTLFAVAYDWRQPNEDSARHLKSSLQTVIDRSNNSPDTDYVAKDGKADLVVHSMGGLVSRAYIQGPYDNNIRKVIFIASPHRGFPFDYRTWEGNTWIDYVYNAPFRSGSGLLFWPLLNRVIWPTLVAKRYQPSPFDLAGCVFHEGFELPGPLHTHLDDVFIFVHDPIPGIFACTVEDVYRWAHDSDKNRGIGSLRQMLPTDDMLPYLIDPITGDPWPYGREQNDFLNDLNARIGDLEGRLGPENLYVIAGDGAPVTDMHYRVLPPGSTYGSNMWAHGTVPWFETGFVVEGSQGDDLIPTRSTSLRLSGLLPNIPVGNEVLLDAEPSQGGARHVSIVYHDEVQRKHVPEFLAGIRVPFKTDYRAPFVFTDEILELFSVVTFCPVDLMVTDPTGKRLGFDPETGQVKREIPNGVYTASGVDPQIIFIADPVPGHYSVTVTGWETAAEGAEYTVRIDRVGQEVAPITVHGGTTGPFRDHVIPVDLTPNHPPVADAGPDQEIAAGEGCLARVTLDGTGSTDPDGDSLAFSWMGPFGSYEGPNPEASLPPGNHEITLTVHDGKGQTDTDTVMIDVVDTTPPEISLPDTLIVEQTNLDGTPVDLPKPIVTDNCTIESVTNDAPAVFPLGTTTVTYFATDESGNAATATMAVSVVDTTPPVLSQVPAPVMVEQVSMDGTEVELPMPTAADICDASPGVTSNAPSVFPLGVTTVTFTATDASGNVARATTRVTVRDTRPPVLGQVPAPVTVEQTSLDGARVKLSMPKATDICDASPEVTSNAPSVFPLGTTTVTFTARDDSGNTAKATTKVTVRDTTPPGMSSVRGNPSELWPPNHKMIPVRVSVSVQDLCDAKPFCKIVSVTSNEPVGGKGGDPAPDWVITGDLSVDLRAERSGGGSGRVYSIQVRCTDDSGNRSYKTGTVTVPHDGDDDDDDDNDDDERGKKNDKKK